MYSEQDWGEGTLSSVWRRSLLLWYFLDDCGAGHRKVPKAAFNTSPSLPGLRGFCLKQDADIEREKIWDILNLQEVAFFISLLNSYAKADAFLIRGFA